MKKIILSIILLIFQFHIHAQTSFILSENGEVENQSAIKKLMKARAYDAMSAFDTISYNPLFIYAMYIKNNKLGIIDHNGVEICKAQYDDINGLNRNYNTTMGCIHKNFTVTVNNKYGLISQRGKMLIPAIYDYIEYKDSTYTRTDIPWELRNYDYRDSAYYATIGKVTTIFNRMGKAIGTEKSEIDYNAEVSVREASEFDDFGYFNSAPPAENEALPSGNIKFQKTENKRKYYGIKDSQKVIIPAIYDFITEDRNHNYILGKDGKFGIADSLNQLKLNIEFESVEEFNGIYFVHKNQKTALFTKSVSAISDFIYGTMHYGNQYLLILNKEGKYGLVNYQGEALTEFKYDHIELITNCNNFEETPLVRVTEGKLKGLFNHKGKALTEVVFDDIIPECTVETESYGLNTPFNMIANTVNLFYFFKRNGKYGIMDTNLNVTTEAIYERMIKSMLDTIVYVAQIDINQHLVWGMLNVNTGKLVAPLKYNTSFKYQRGGYFNHNRYISGGYFLAKLNGNYGLIDDQGKVIVPFEWPKEFYSSLIYNGLLKIESFSPNVEFYVDYMGNSTK